MKLRESDTALGSVRVRQQGCEFVNVSVCQFVQAVYIYQRVLVTQEQTLQFPILQLMPSVAVP